MKKRLFRIIDPTVNGLDYSNPGAARVPKGPQLGDLVVLEDTLSGPAPLLTKYRNGFRYRYELANLQEVSPEVLDRLLQLIYVIDVAYLKGYTGLGTKEFKDLSEESLARFEDIVANVLTGCDQPEGAAVPPHFSVVVTTLFELLQP